MSNKISKNMLRRLIREEMSRHLREEGSGAGRRMVKHELHALILQEARAAKLHEYGSRGNEPPARDSNWYEFAEALDIGVLDLDEMAYELGFQDFYDMDTSISPGALAKRDPKKFAEAAQNSSMMAQDMSTNEIVGWARPEGY